jgi:hypothetical protein
MRVLIHVTRALKALERATIVHGGINLEGVFWRRTNSGVKGMLHNYANLRVKPYAYCWNAGDMASFSDMLHLLFPRRVALQPGPINSLLIVTKFICRKTFVRVSHLVQILTDAKDQLQSEEPPMAHGLESPEFESSSEFDGLHPLLCLVLRWFFSCLI